jgi:acetyltransferase-like isoleucine patch superfamily enzyme
LTIMSIASSVKFLARSLFTLSLLLSPIGSVIAGEIPTIATKTNLSDAVLDRTATTPKTSLAQSGSTTSNSASKRNDVGIGIRFGNSSSFGIDGKFGVADNFSLRPSIYFGNKPGVENQAGSLPVDIASTAPFTITESFKLPTSYTVPQAFSTAVPFTLGAAVTVGGTTFPAGSTIPAGTTVPAGVIIPAGTSVAAGTTIPAGTFLPQGFPVPAGLITNQNSGTAFGLAATYDFKLDDSGRSTAYIGPKIEFGSASGQVTAAGTPVPNTKINVNQTKIGIIGGGDFAVSDDFTVGANVTLNLSNSVDVTPAPGFSAGGLNLNNFSRSTGSSIDFGIRAAYRF